MGAGNPPLAFPHPRLVAPGTPLQLCRIRGTLLATPTVQREHSFLRESLLSNPSEVQLG